NGRILNDDIITGILDCGRDAACPGKRLAADLIIPGAIVCRLIVEQLCIQILRIECNRVTASILGQYLIRNRLAETCRSGWCCTGHKRSGREHTVNQQSPPDPKPLEIHGANLLSLEGPDVTVGHARHAGHANPNGMRYWLGLSHLVES